MKKITQYFLALLLGLTLLSSSASADAFKGGRILGNAMLHGSCPMILADLAGTHVRDEWAKIVQEGKLQETITQICPKAKVDPIPEKDMKDVLDYLQYYSRGGGALPSC